MQIHAAMVDRVDQNVGRLVTKLKAIGEFENTLVFFLVDNGSSHERPGRGRKAPGSKWGTVGSFEAIGQSWANATNSPMRKWKVQGLEGGICTPMIALGQTSQLLYPFGGVDVPGVDRNNSVYGQVAALPCIRLTAWYLHVFC